MSSTFGHLFRVSTFGESHGAGLGCVVDGCPPRLPLTEAVIQAALDRRRPGQSDLTTPRQEPDRIEILSGVQDGVTLGTPIGLLIRNTDQKPADYKSTDEVPRPSHADYTYQQKYGLRARSGGGRASARETAARVAAGAVAMQLLRLRWGVEIVSWVDAVGADAAAMVDPATVGQAAVDANAVRCPDPAAAGRFTATITAARDDGDSVGGVVACVVRGCPAGWANPCSARRRPCWPAPCFRCRRARVSRSAAASQAPGYAAASTTTPSSPAATARSAPRPTAAAGCRGDHQRGACGVPGGLQADVDHRQGTGDGGLRGPRDGAGREGSARPLRAAAGRCPSSRPWPRW